MSARRLVLVALLSLSSLGAVSPVGAGAFATVGAPPNAGPAGLPDGRVYEEVSPANKFGNSAGQPFVGTFPPFMAATVDGEGVIYTTSGGPIGESTTGFTFWSVSDRGADGWSTHSAVPRAIGTQGNFNCTTTRALGASAEDFSKILYESCAPYVPEQQNYPMLNGQIKIFLAHSEGPFGVLGQPQWIDAPRIANPGSASTEIAGASSDLSTVYFEDTGSLLADGEEPTARVAEGLFEWRNGALSYAGVLPNGTMDPKGAIAAGGRTCLTPSRTRNQVSSDGSRVFFLSPIPELASPSDPSELYVRETAPSGSQRTVLVSRDELLPDVNGEPAPAADAPVGVVYPGEVDSEVGARCPVSASYMYASPDGSHVFFQSTEQLTSAAPADTEVKAYEFDLATEELTYLPDFTAGTQEGATAVLAATPDGSRALLEQSAQNPGGTAELALWSSGPGGGQVTPVLALPGEDTDIGPVRITADGEAIAFETNAPLAGFNDGGVGQVYRYDVAQNALSCVSCPPAAVTPTGNADFTHDYPEPGIIEDENLYTESRGMSSDGSRIFFDTPEALVPQDTDGVRDVYEWENGTIYLLSTGTSAENSFFGDNSADGNDVIFSTSEGLAEGDADESYDVYDARIPRPGDSKPPTAVPCQGDVCQGPPNIPAAVTPPMTATFNGPGNLVPAQTGSAVSVKHAKRPVKHKRRRARKRHRPARHKVKGRQSKVNRKVKG